MRLRLAVLSCLLMTGSVHACNIPVFRYALEQWKPDPFDITVLAYEVPRLDQSPVGPEPPDAQDLRGMWNFSLEGYAYGNYYLNAIELHALAAARFFALNPGQRPV